MMSKEVHVVTLEHPLLGPALVDLLLQAAILSVAIVPRTTVHGDSLFLQEQV